MRKYVILDLSDGPTRNYQKEPTDVYISTRDNYKDIQQNNAIYILMSPTRRYIGQATNIQRRLSQHDKQKDWWDSVVTFGRIDGQLTKSHLDYLEKRLIQIFTEKKIYVENETSGNESYLSEIEILKCENLILDTLRILGETNVDLFTVKKLKIEHLIRFDDKTYVGQLPKLYQDIMKDIVDNYAIWEYIIDTVPNRASPIGRQPEVLRGKTKTTQISNTLHLYTPSSSQEKELVLKNFLSKIGLDVSIESTTIYT